MLRFGNGTWTQPAARRTVGRVTSGYLVEPNTACRLQFGGMGLTVEVANECLAGKAAAMRIRLDSRRVIPPHLHRREDEVTFVLRGPVGVQVDDEEFQAPSGSPVVAPRMYSMPTGRRGTTPSSSSHSSHQAASSTSSRSSIRPSTESSRRAAPIRMSHRDG